MAPISVAIPPSDRLGVVAAIAVMGRVVTSILPPGWRAWALADR